MLKVLDLFSGIGGFSLGLERTGGFETVAFCEIEPFCQKVLKKHWPDVPIFEDVRTLDYEGPVDVICGGYPCQPFSLAGKRQGAEDDRHLWPAMFSLIQKHRPDWVIGENVAGHITMGLDQVLADLESENYATRAFVIPACAADAHHRRDRVWIVANATKLLCNGSGENSEPDKRQISELGERGCKANVPNSMRCRSQRPGRAFNASDTAASEDWQEHRTKHDGRWCPEPNVGRVAHGISSELDGDLNDEEKHYPNEGSKSDAGPNRMPRVSGKGQTREASPGLYETQHIRGSLPSVSHQGRPAGRNPQKEAAEGLQDMRDNVFAKPHKETQHMQQEMSVRDRPEKRNEALVWPEEPEGLPRVARGVPDRVNRLRALGNALIPQIVERIGRAIIEAEREKD